MDGAFLVAAQRLRRAIAYLSFPSCAPRPIGLQADASVSAESALSSFDMQAFYRSWLRTIADSQASAAALKDCAADSPIFPDCDGADTDTSPHVPGLFGNRPADPSWGSALDIIYDLLLRYYADFDAARAFYPSLTAYADYLLRIADKTGGLVTFHWYGDWLQPNQVPSLDYVSEQTSAFNFLRTLRVAINAAAVLGEAEDAERYTARYTAAAAAYNAAYFNVSGSGCYGTGRQNENVYAGYLEIVPGGSDLAGFVARCLVPAIVANASHVDTGIVSTKYLMPLLSRAGRSDLALQLALNEDFPSWAAMAFVFNETTITEHWNPVNNPSGNGMSSRNHPAFGSVGSWLYQALLGVRLGDAASAEFSVPGLPPGAPSPRAPDDGYGFARAVVAPEIVTNPRLPSASGGIWTAAGFVGASWAFAPGVSLAVNASFPAATTRGEVRTPTSMGPAWLPSAITITEGGAAVWKAGAFVDGAEGVWAGAACGAKLDRVCLQTGSGSFSFVVTPGGGAAPAQQGVRRVGRNWE